MKEFKAHIPYEDTFLIPALSDETIKFHYGKHHCGYANMLNMLTADSVFSDKSLEEVIITSRGVNQKVFNNAAQLYSHDFYWKCLNVTANSAPNGKLKHLISNQFESFQTFLEQYIAFANLAFGSGWSWLVENSGKLSFLNTQNAENPIGTLQTPVCVIDLWEHAYYIDYRNDRSAYINKIINGCIDWEFCSSQIK